MATAGIDGVPTSSCVLGAGARPQWAAFGSRRPQPLGVLLKVRPDTRGLRAAFPVPLTGPRPTTLSGVCSHTRLALRDQRSAAQTSTLIRPPSRAGRTSLLTSSPRRSARHVRGNTARAQERVISTGNANASKAFADQLAGRAASACPIAANKIKVKHSTPSHSVMAQRMDCRSPESSAQHPRTRS